MKIKHLLGIGFFTIFLSCKLSKETKDTATEAPISRAEVEVAAKVIYPKSREWASPAGGMTAQFNPPSLAWPIDQKASYSVRLSPTSDFSAHLVEAQSLPYALYNPHQELEAGSWYWQYKSGDGPWSKTNAFEINEKSQVFATPDAQTLLAKIPVERPRVLAWKSNLTTLRTQAKIYKEAAEILATAQDLLSVALIEEKEAIPTFTGRNARESRRIAIDASRPVCDRVQYIVSRLSQAYLLSGEEKYAQTGLKWILALADWDPEGPTRVTDFGDSGVMHAMAVGYDSFYGLLSTPQREKLLQAIAARGAHFYEHWVNFLEARLISNHVWQHILERFFQTALAVKGDLPIADEWLTYSYEIWLANSPKLGHRDGAWSNGVGYFNMNTLTLLSITATLQEITGLNFMQDEWYYNNPEWLIYAFPPHSASDAFGNDGSRFSTQSPIYISWTDLNARLTGNPYARWYADQSMKGTKMTLSGDESLKWFYLQRGFKLDRPKPLAKFDLPQARAFREVGVAYLHTDLTNTPSNLMLAFKSSPYGSYSHTHAEHNGFNLFYGGKALFSNSGYRPAMGDPHYLADYKNTRGHNSILINNMGQPFGSEAYGWIPRFLHGEQISYVVGDATNAYSATDARELKTPGNPSKNHSDAGLVRFRRHLLLLRPSTVIVYDELETKAPAQFTFLLHNQQKLVLNPSDQSVTASNEHAQAQAQLFASTELDHLLTDQFADPPVNWRRKKNPDGSLLEYANHFHYQATNKEKTKKMRFLGIIQLDAPQNGLSIEDIKRDKNAAAFQIGEWTIAAGMDANKPAFLKAWKNDDTAALSSSGKVNLRGRQFEGRLAGSSKLVEMIDGELVFKEGGDEVPEGVEAALRLGKQ